MVCAFYPKPGACEEVYRQAMRDNSISAEAVGAEYRAMRAIWKARHHSLTRTVNSSRTTVSASPKT